MPKRRSKYKAKMSTQGKSVEAEFKTKAEILQWVEKLKREGYRLVDCNYDIQFNQAEFKKDCFAFGINESARCAILFNKECKNCKFYKTKKQFKEDANKTKIRNEKEQDDD